MTRRKVLGLLSTVFASGSFTAIAAITNSPRVNEVIR